MEYEIIRSNRKSVAIQVKDEGIFVRAPLRMPEYDKWNRWLKENGPALMRRQMG